MSSRVLKQHLAAFLAGGKETKQAAGSTNGGAGKKATAAKRRREKKRKVGGPLADRICPISANPGLVAAAESICAIGLGSFRA